MTRPEVYLDDATSCPAAAACDACRDDAELEVVTFRCDLGVGCATLCPTCTALPAMSLRGALDRVCAHARHLEVDLDLMAEVLDGEDG